MKVAVIMGSISDYPIMKLATQTIITFGIKVCERIVSAHRTPQEMVDFAKTAHEHYQVIIAGAGGAAHLPGMVASLTTLPVIGVPVKSKALQGVDSLLSILQMPRGTPVATVGINSAVNAALLALRILAVHDGDLQQQLTTHKNSQEEEALASNKQLSPKS